MRGRLGWVMVWMLLAAGHLRGQALFSFNEEGMARSRLELSAHGHEVTGLCLMRLSDDVLCGSVVNEFGIKAFDFTYRPLTGKTKLMNVASFLNKWYIRRTLQRDLSFLFGQSAPCARGYRTVEREKDGVALVNKRHRLTYRFLRLNETTE